MPMMSAEVFRVYGLALLRGLDLFTELEVNRLEEQGQMPSQEAGLYSQAEQAYVAQMQDLYDLDADRALDLDKLLVALFELPLAARERSIETQANILAELGHIAAARALAKRLTLPSIREPLLQALGGGDSEEDQPTEAIEQLETETQSEDQQPIPPSAAEQLGFDFSS
jgi:hypothetical protein